MAGESIHDKLGRVRKPRVHIVYEVAGAGGPEQKELPFVVGVLGDFSGKPTAPLKPLGQRDFVEIDRGNFDEVLARMTPGLNLTVENKLKDDGTEMSVQLKFEKLDDFNPENVARQVEPLRKLLEKRQKLVDLKATLESNSDVEKELDGYCKDPEKRGKLQGDLGSGSEGEEKGGK